MFIFHKSNLKNTFGSNFFLVILLLTEYLDPIYLTPPLVQDMTQGQFLSGV